LVGQSEKLFQSLYRLDSPVFGSPFRNLYRSFVWQSEELFQPLDFGDDLFRVHTVPQFITRSMLELATTEV
jgi:hypothetical protein